MPAMSDDAGRPEVPDEVQRAWNAGDAPKAARLLDEWEARQPPTRELLLSLRFWRRHIGQVPKAIAVVRRLLEQRDPDSWERVSDLCTLGELHLQAGEPDVAWAALSEAAGWGGLRDWYECGLVRSVVELGLDLSASLPPDAPLARRSFDLAVSLLEDGASSSLVILDKARDRAEALGEAARHAALAAAARDLRRALHGRERRRPPSGGE